MNIKEISSHVDNKWELEVFFFSEHRGESQFHSGPEIFVINWSISHHHCSHCHHHHLEALNQVSRGAAPQGTYMIFVIFLRHRIFWPVNCTPEKCINLRQKIAFATKPRKSILGVLAVLVGILAVLVGVLAILVGVLGVLRIGLVYLLHEIEHSELGLV